MKSLNAVSAPAPGAARLQEWRETSIANSPPPVGGVATRQSSALPRLMASRLGVWLAVALGVAGTPLLPAADEPDAAKVTEAEVTTNTAPAALEQTGGPDASAPPPAAPRREFKHAATHREAVVTFGEDAILKAGESAEAVVAIGGNAIVEGTVLDAVVAVGGDVRLSGEVRDVVVAVMGSVELATNAYVRGDVVAVGGRVTHAEGATVGGETHEVAIAGLHLSEMAWVKDFVAKCRNFLVHCVFKMRPLAPQVGWVWIVAGIFLLAYVLMAAVFARPVAACVQAAEQRPATTFFVGLLTIFLFPLLCLILAATGVGLLGVPFLLAALVFAGFAGKVALLEFIGLGLGRQLKAAALERPLIALLIGWVILSLLYLVPFLGLVVWTVAGLWGLGIATTAFFASFRKELPERTPPPAASSGIPLSPAPAPAARAAAEAAAVPVLATAMAGGPPVDTPPVIGAGAAALVSPEFVPAAAGPAATELLALPRASFWERMGAGALDLILITIVSNLVPIPMAFALYSLAYFAGMWFWKGTTVGGILLNLKVVRTDAQPLTWPVCLVRALAAAFSTIVLFLGFFWIAWDRDREGWHDKLAGTAVVKLPKAMPLVVI